jgi:transposase
MAIVQIRHDTACHAYIRRRVAAGTTRMETLRALTRRLSDVVYLQLVADAGKASREDTRGRQGTGPVLPVRHRR